MKQRGSTLRIARTGYKISLLRVAPGEESAVARRLTQAIQQHTPAGPVCLLKLFGRFDLCAIYRTDDYKEGPSKAGPIPGIRGANKILAFRWLLHGQARSLNVEGGHGHVWALSFFRFNQSLVKKYGAGIETALAAYWYNKGLQGVALDILGTTGWAEALFILRGRRFSDVAIALDTISRQEVITKHSPAIEVELVPTKTVSVIGIDFDLVRHSEAHRLPRRLSEKYENGSGVFPVLHVTCPAGSMQKVFDYASENIGTDASPRRRVGPGSIAFGVTDLVFTPQSGQWGDLLYTLIQMRRTLNRHLYSTSLSVLRHPSEDSASSLKPPRRSYLLPERRPLKIRASLAGMFGKWDAFEGRLRNLYFGLSNLLQDPIIGQCFDDLRPFATRSLPRLLRQAPKSDEFLPSLVNDAIDVLHHGAQERAHGAFLAIEQLEASLSPTKGGIQRIIAAASVIPRALFSRIKHRWSGFLVTGYYNEPFTSHYDIVNLPFEFLFRPEQWTGLFHEVGHAAIFDDSFFDMDDPRIARALKSGLGSQSDEEYERWYDDMVFEVGADLFAQYFCYGTDLRSYLPNVWQFVLRPSGTLSEDHFVRFFIVHQYSKYCLQGGHAHFPANMTLLGDIGEFRQTLTELNLKTEVSGLSSEKVNHAALYSFEMLAPVIELYHLRFCQRAPPRRLSEELNSPELRKALKSVLNGEVVSNTITAPDAFILALKKQEANLSVASRQAAIISLWHTAVSRQT